MNEPIACPTCNKTITDPCAEAMIIAARKDAASLAEADAVIFGHWQSHRIDGAQWRLEDQARPVREAIERHMQRASHE